MSSGFAYIVSLGITNAWAGNVNVTPGVTMEMPNLTNTVPFPTPSYPSSSNAQDSDSTCDYGCQSSRNQIAYLKEQCRLSGGRQYYCRDFGYGPSNGGLTPAQGDVIKKQTDTLLQQYRIYENGTWYTR